MTIGKFAHPRKAALDAVYEQIEEKSREIESGPEEGKRVVDWDAVQAAFDADLEPPSDYSTEVATPGIVYVSGTCPQCGEAANLKIELSAELRVDAQGGALRLKGKSKEVTHTCGQVAMGLDSDQESFELGDIVPLEGEAEGTSEDEEPTDDAP